MHDNMMSIGAAECTTLIKQKRFAEAIDALKSVEEVLPTAETYALLALAHFHSEHYELAVTNYEKALAFDPGNDEYKEMLQHAKGNSISQVNIPIPRGVLF